MPPRRRRAFKLEQVVKAVSAPEPHCERGKRTGAGLSPRDAQVGVRSDDLFTQALREAEPRLRARIAQFAPGDPDQADDLFQEVSIRLWEKRGTYRGYGPFAAWACRVANRVCLSASRRGDRPGVRAPFSGPLVARFDVGESEAELVARKLREDAYLESVTDAVVRLPPRKRVMVLLHWYLGQDAASIARLLGLTVPSVWTALSQAKRVLRGMIPPPASDDDEAP